MMRKRENLSWLYHSAKPLFLLSLATTQLIMFGIPSIERFASSGIAEEKIIESEKLHVHDSRYQHPWYPLDKRIMDLQLKGRQDQLTQQFNTYNDYMALGDVIGARMKDHGVNYKDLQY